LAKAPPALSIEKDSDSSHSSYSKKEEVVESDSSEHDVDGEYLPRIWEQDCKLRRTKSPSKDSAID
jgi:hypothetical protein